MQLRMTEHLLAGAQQLHYLVTEIAKAGCEATGPDPIGPVGYFPNIPKSICKIIVPFTIAASYALVLAADISHHVFYRKYEIVSH